MCDNKIKSGDCYLEAGPLEGKVGVGEKERVARWNCDTKNNKRGSQFTFKPDPADAAAKKEAVKKATEQVTWDTVQDKVCYGKYRVLAKKVKN